MTLLISVGCLPCDPSKCLACDETSGLCAKCKDGFFLSLLQTKSNLGECSQCMDPCRTCTDAFYCTSCNVGHVMDSANCLSCAKGCSECLNNTTYCTACTSEYKLDDNNHCYFKYTLYIVAGSAVTLFMLMLGLVYLIAWIIRPSQKLTGYSAILEHQMKGPAGVIVTVSAIGSQDTGLDDLSKVAPEDLKEGSNGGSLCDILGASANRTTADHCSTSEPHLKISADDMN